jgi:hypothetical protein
MAKITIVAFDKFTDIDIFLAWDLFNRTKFRATDVSVKIVGTKEKHKSVCGINLDMHGQDDVIASVLPIGQGQVCIY